MSKLIEKKQQDKELPHKPNELPVFEELKLTKLHIDRDSAVKARMQTAKAKLAMKEEKTLIQQQKLKEANELKKQQQQCLAAIRQESLER